jgi:hypothetical protein
MPHTHAGWFIWYEVHVYDVSYRARQTGASRMGGEIAGQEGGEHGPKAHGYW